MKNEFKPIDIKKQFLKHVSKHNIDDENNKTIDFNNIIINI